MRVGFLTLFTSWVSHRRFLHVFKGLNAEPTISHIRYISLGFSPVQILTCLYKFDDKAKAFHVRHIYGMPLQCLFLQVVLGMRKKQRHSYILYIHAFLLTVHYLMINQI